MSHTWKFLPLAALFALGAFMLLPGGNVSPTPDVVRADIDCDSVHRLTVEIIDNDTDDLIEVAGAEITIDPDPQDGSGTRTFEDNGSNDDDDAIGSIEQDEACEVNNDTEDDDYVITLDSLPEPYDEDCEYDDTIELDELTGNETVEFVLDNCDVELTPTATNTSVTGPAATIVVTSSNNNLACGATSIVTITVRGANGQPVANGTIVNIVADKGSVSPTSGQTTADGSVFVFYTAPNNEGGEATITAASGSALGSAEIDLNCNTAPTQAPPPTSAVGGGGIQPPNTGDGGLSTGNSWHAYAGVALILSSVVATLAVIRPRA
jgi:hypothetical protein